MPLRILIACALSGAAALVYETAWGRLLRLAFGGTSESHATVLAAFMLGLALGAVAGGRAADRRSAGGALRLFGWCEAGVGVLGLASLFVLRAFPEWYAAVGGGRGLRVVCAGALLLPPTMCMGATLPLLVRGLVAHGDVLARLYALNTAGAVAGALLTGFVLLPWLGVSGSIVAAALVNGLAARLAWRAADEVTEAAAPGAQAGRPGAAPETRGRGALLAAAALSGACALGLEVVWSRTLVLIAGSSTQAFALMLGTFLAGLTLGSAAFARWAPERGAARVAGMLLLASSAGSVLLLHLAARMPFAYVAFWSLLPHEGVPLLALRLLAPALLMFAPACLMGASLPALARAYAECSGGRRPGFDTGAVYGANTAGGIAGALGTSLWALPALGVSGSAGAVAALGVAASALVLVVARSAALALVPLAVAAVCWTPPWNPVVMGKGYAYLARKVAPLAEKGELATAAEQGRVLSYRDGAESTVLVYDGGEGTRRSFVVNGRHEATSAPSDMRNQYLLGHLPALLHDGPVREGLVIALGSGMTAGCLAKHASRVTVVELEPHVVDAARTFAEWNHGAVGDPRVNIVIGDGRHFLMTTTARYDVITVDPIHPSVVGSDALYAVEQYRLVKSRLARGGVAAQWLPLYEMGLDDARAITRTFHAVFEDAQVWVNGADAVLIGGAGGVLDAARLRDGLAQPEIARSLGHVRLSKLGTFLAGLALTPDGVKRYVQGAPLLTDDRPLLEFSLPWKMYAESINPNVLELYRHADREPAVSTEGLSEDDLRGLQASRAALQADLAGLALSIVKHDRAAAELFRLALEQDPDDLIAREMLGK